MTKLITNVHVTKLVHKAVQGPPGPSGAGVGLKQGTFSEPLPVETNPPVVPAVVLIPYALYAMVVDGLYGLKTQSGSIDVTILINDVPITGLDEVTVTDTPQNALATALNEVEEGDRVTLEFSNNSSAVGLEFTFKATA